MPAIIDFTAPIACFRVPLHHNYHRSFPLPPPTTVIGILAGALGLDESGIDEWLREAKPLLGIAGKHDGGGNELMTVRKVTGGGKIKPGQYSTILLRELRTQMKCRFLVRCESDSIEQELVKAVNSPRYPTSAGPADFLALLRGKWVPQFEEKMTDRLQHCIAPGALWGKATIDAQALKNTFLLETVAGPNSWNLPIAWYLGKKGERLPAEFSPFTFLTSPVILKEPISCVLTTLENDCEPIAVPLLGPFDKWLISTT
ncbi:MAG: CRISPR-associated protein Cas5 [Calditrichaeota bacterium]|nr:MAG: CRISPR-associated protein Cas5 [Calditrichota bacterium]